MRGRKGVDFELCGEEMEVLERGEKCSQDTLCEKESFFQQEEK